MTEEDIESIVGHFGPDKKEIKSILYNLDWEYIRKPSVSLNLNNQSYCDFRSVDGRYVTIVLDSGSFRWYRSENFHLNYLNSQNDLDELIYHINKTDI